MSHDKLEPQVTLYHNYSTDKSCNRRVFSLTVGKVSLGRGGEGARMLLKLLDGVFHIWISVTTYVRTFHPDLKFLTNNDILWRHFPKI